MELLTTSDVYAVLTHSKYLINQEQNGFHSVKKSSSGNKNMKSDLYIKKSSFGYHQNKIKKKNTGSVTKASSSFKFLNLFDEYSYVFCPGTQQEPFGGVKEKKKKD